MATVYLRVSVFVAGFAIMAAEMAAPRLLAPSFGTTQLVWTNVIGTILLALTLGAYVGGRLADRWPTERAYARVLVLAGVLLALVPLASRSVLAHAARALAELEASSFFLSLAAVSLFFAPPVFLLGMIAPWAIRLGGLGRADLGHVAGVLSGLGAAGSILGTFATSLAALPLLGTRDTLLGVAALLALTGGWRAVLPRRSGVVLTLAFSGFAWAARGNVREDPGQVFEAESLYNYIQVRVDPQGWTRLLLNEGFGDQSVRPPTGIVTHGVWDFLSLAPALAAEPTDDLRVLILGLAAGTVASQIEAAYADRQALSIDGVELDPAVIEAGKAFFDLNRLARLRTHVGDARVALETLPGPYDAIIVDAYRGNYLPFHLATREFFAACRGRLSEGGVLAINLALPPGSEALQDALAETLHQVPLELRRFVVPDRAASSFENVILFATKSPLRRTDLDQIPYPLRDAGRVFLSRIASVEAPAGSTPALTDDRAPVELLTDAAILRLARGR